MKKTVYSLAFAHLLLVAVVIFHGLSYYPDRPFLEKSLSFLTTVNYSAWRFGFFTPDVGKSTEVEIILYRDSTDMIKYSTLKDFDFFTSNRESANRFYGFKVHAARDSNFQDLSTRSASTRLLNLHPGYKGISYTMRGIIYPDMVDFRNDSTIKQGEFYRIDFAIK